MKLFGKRSKELKPMAEINAQDVAEDFANYEKKTCTDPYLQHAWVSVCIDILSRNVGRADFEIQKNGLQVTDTPLAKLFERPNKTMSRFDLWKITTAWWSLEGEAFWWFGENYSCGVPKEIHVLLPDR